MSRGKILGVGIAIATVPASVWWLLLLAVSDPAEGANIGGGLIGLGVIGFSVLAAVLFVVKAFRSRRGHLD